MQQQQQRRRRRRRQPGKRRPWRGRRRWRRRQQQQQLLGPEARRVRWGAARPSLARQGSRARTAVQCKQAPPNLPLPRRLRPPPVQQGAFFARLNKYKKEETSTVQTDDDQLIYQP